MNIYFIDPNYILDNVWSPLFKFLKIKSVWSFIPETELSKSIIESSQGLIKGMYNNQDMVAFIKNSSYWLAGHIAKHMPIQPEESEENINKIDILQHNHPTSSALYNINNFEEENCLVLIPLKTTYNNQGEISKPHNYCNALKPSNIPTNIAKSCLNILRYRYDHDLYRERCAFVMFDKYMSSSYYYDKWWYPLSYNNKNNNNQVLFSNVVKVNIHKLCPQYFPLIGSGKRQSLSPIITESGKEEYSSLLKEAELKYEEHMQHEIAKDEAEQWEKEMKEAEYFALGGRSYDSFTRYR